MTETEYHIRFRSHGKAYFLPAAEVDGVGELPIVHPVPGAPPGVAGICAWNGRIYTVVDPPGGEAAGGKEAGPERMVRLAPPLERTALRIRGPVETGPPVVGATRMDLRRLLADTGPAGDGV